MRCSVGENAPLGPRTVIACSSRASDLGVKPCHLLIWKMPCWAWAMPGAAVSAPPRTAALNAPTKYKTVVNLKAVQCCRCRKLDPVGDWRGIGQSCVGCGISAGCSSVWSWTCFGHERRWKPKSWCSNSRSSCCVGVSQVGCDFLPSTRSFWAGPVAFFRAPISHSRDIRCGEELTLPECSKYRNEREVDHFLAGWKCDCRFQIKAGLSEP